jgi:hypothetical protein
VLNEERRRQRWRELRDLVNARDPIGLIASRAPQDEYECLVGPVLLVLEQGASQEAIVSYLADDCRDHFGSPIAESSVREFAVRAAAWYQRRCHSLGGIVDVNAGKASDFCLDSSSDRGRTVAGTPVPIAPISGDVIRHYREFSKGP